MQKRVFALVIALAITPVIALAVDANQSAIDALRAQIAQLQQQLTVLLAQQEQAVPASSLNEGCHTFSANLGFRDSGSSEVGHLHAALQKQGISYAPDEGNTYGSGTARAVSAFQVKYSAEVLAPSGLSQGTGFFGASTRAKMNRLYGCAAPQAAAQPVLPPAQSNTQISNPTATQTVTATPTVVQQPTQNPVASSWVSPVQAACVSNWICSGWTACSSGSQTRYCADSSNCGVLSGKPLEFQACATSSVTPSTSTPSATSPGTTSSPTAGLTGLVIRDGLGESPDGFTFSNTKYDYPGLTYRATDGRMFFYQGTPYYNRYVAWGFPTDAVAAGVYVTATGPGEITVNGTRVSSGIPSRLIPVTPGSETVITITASSKTYTVRLRKDLGVGNAYQGGVVAYLLKPDDSGYVAGETHGLIIPEKITSVEAYWGCWSRTYYTYVDRGQPAPYAPPAGTIRSIRTSSGWYAELPNLLLSGARATAIGTGKQNTQDIIRECKEFDIAARVADGYVSGGYDDWFLPSRDEMLGMYGNRFNLYPVYAMEAEYQIPGVPSQQDVNALAALRDQNLFANRSNDGARALTARIYGSSGENSSATDGAWKAGKYILGIYDEFFGCDYAKDALGYSGYPVNPMHTMFMTSTQIYPPIGNRTPGADVYTRGDGPFGAAGPGTASKDASSCVMPMRQF